MQNSLISSVKSASTSLIVIASVISLLSHGQDITMTAESPKQHYLLGEPVLIRVTFGNNGAKPGYVTQDMGLEWGGLRFDLSHNQSEFVRLRPFAELDPSGRSIEIKPGERLVHEEMLYFNTRTRASPLFTEPGRYVIRVASRQGTNTVGIEIVQPSGSSNIRASELMRSRAVIEFVGLGRSSERVIQDLKECITSKSDFAPYAALFLAAREGNKTIALSFLEKADAIGFPLQSRVILEKGRISLELGDKQKAQAQFKRVLAEFPDSGAASQVRSSRLLEMVADKPAPPDPVADAVKELESEFYDLKGYWRSYQQLPWVREYSKKRLELYDRWAAGGLTEAERKQQEAALMREYVRKHAKPLDPAEWKRRYDGYAKEEEAQRAKQMEELRQMREAREKTKNK